MRRIIVNGAKSRKAQIPRIWSHTRRYGEYYNIFLLIYRDYLVHFMCFTGYGISSDGKIIYINASTCDLNYLPSNSPIVFDITLPPGVKKS